MAELPPGTVQSQDPESRPKRPLIVRVRRFAAICDVIASMFLLATAALSLLILALAINGQTEWPHVTLLIAVCLFSLGLGFTALLLARYESLGLGWLGIILGLLLANAPLLLALLSTWLHFSLHNLLMMAVGRITPGVGIYLIIVSVTHLVAANIYYIIHSRQLVVDQFRQDGKMPGSKKQVISFIPKCWEMYACPDAARAKCPNFIDQVNCWKRRRGCLCDHRLSLYLFHGPLAKDTVQFTNPQRLDLSQFANLDQYPTQLREEKPRSWRQRRPFCHNCAVFMEHQSYKYKRFNWIFLPISLVLMLLLFPYFHLAYNLGAHALDKLAHHLAESGNIPQGFYSDASHLVGSPYEYLLMVVLAMLLMSYVVEFTDWCLLEWKV